MLKYTQLKVLPGYDKDTIICNLAKKLNIAKQDIRFEKILKESIDARKKPDLFYSLSVAFTLPDEHKLLSKNKDQNLSLYQEQKFYLPCCDCTKSTFRPIVIGAGPAGLFCAYYLAKAGLKPILYERGKDVDSRTKDVLDFWENGVLNTDSNVQFGEGGAGTFSDGKLNTLNKDPFGYQKEVLSLFVQMGAKESIIYEQKPHLGTDCLLHIVKSIREEICRLGGNVYFNSQVTDFIIEKNNNSDDCKSTDVNEAKIVGIEINNQEIIKTDTVVLAIGHSARDTFRLLYKKQISMEAKSFAVGYRVQHLQSDINICQYGDKYASKLPAASYKLTAQAGNGRGVYSFCMCPGGYVVNASSEHNRLCVNGMSYSDRSGQNANSAIIVAVTPEDYPNEGPLSGVFYQEALEARAYQVCNGKVPVQLLCDYKANKISESLHHIQPAIKGQYAFGNLRNIYSKEIESAFLEGMEQFGKKIKGFDDDDVLITGIEPRTSSPVRIHRDKDCQSPSVKGLYPCGEGAGYAGGITSAACDGLKVACEIILALGGSEQ